MQTRTADHGQPCANDDEFTCEGLLPWLCKVACGFAAFAVLGISLLLAAGWRP